MLLIEHYLNAYRLFWIERALLLLFQSPQWLYIFTNSAAKRIDVDLELNFIISYKEYT